MAVDPVADFIARWHVSGASERANKDLFLTELCDVLGVPRPDPATGDSDRDLYVFERESVIQLEGGKVSTGHIDLYKDACFVLEAKQGSAAGAKKTGTARRETPGWTVAMQAAFGQALSYARTQTNPPPFILVADIGYCFDLYATFDGSTSYRPFPRPQGHRVFFKDLGNHLETLRRIWTEPAGLDPTRNAARVTREIAVHLAELARSLETSGHSAERTAAFLMRALFTMFAEDAGLLPKHLFTKLLEERWVTEPESFVPEVENLWQTMRTGGHVVGIGRIRKFNGGFFNEHEALPLTQPQLRLLLEAGRASWTEVEPAIFGTLLERALVPKERHALGAHFTPRAYVERLVRPTIEEPLREEWDVVRAQVHALAKEEKVAEAQKALKAFHERLCKVRILDPACGTGNFLYVALDLLKRLESEVLGLLQDLGESQGLLDLHGVTVSPAQLLGIEINPRAREIAELVLWIGFLRWQYGSLGKGATIPEPVLHDYGNIECRDAILACDRIEPLRDEKGEPVTRWDGETTKIHPVTGELVPDESARSRLWTYVNPRQAEWPQADYVLGNPPYIGNFKMRSDLGDGYVQALRLAYPELPESIDLVLYWWDRAARLIEADLVRRAGLITTTSITHTFNRRVVEAHLQSEPGTSIVFAAADHPWVSAKFSQAQQGEAEVRIAMSVLAKKPRYGTLATVTSERETDGELLATVATRQGLIHANFTIGANVNDAASLGANGGISCPGVKLHGAGFIVTEGEAASLGLGRIPGLDDHLRPYRNGQDLASRPRGVLVIDLLGLTEVEARSRFPEVFERVLQRVRPERDHNNREIYRRNWWLFGEPRKEFRPALRGLRRYIATPESARRRYFVFLDGSVLPDNSIVVIASDDAFHLGVLSSRIHVVWALATGGRLGVRHDPRYNKSRCFETFPFPAPEKGLESRVRSAAETLEGHRQMCQSKDPDLKLTKLYKALSAFAAGEPLDASDAGAFRSGLGTTLMQLHQDLDDAVFEAYGWPATLTDEEILERLVALNAERAEEEKRGLVRWLRPEFQNPAGEKAAVQGEIDTDEAEEEGVAPVAAKAVPWPKSLPDRIALVRDWSLRLRAPVTSTEAAGSFSGARTGDVEPLLDSLAALGILRSFEGQAGRLWAAAGSGAAASAARE